VLGFYLPFHLYYQPGSPHQIWGIYLIGSAIRQFGIWIWEQTGRTIQVRQCCKVAQGFVYLHEYFHHRAESLCTRLEVAAGGKRVYLAWVMSKFLAGLASNPKVVREEGMAEAYALREWTEKAKKKLMPKLNRTETIQIAAALRLYTKLTGPPYDAGLAWTSEQVFKNEQAILCEDYRDAQSYNGGSRHLAWHAATFMTRGLMTVHQQFWYVWNIPGLPVAGGGSGSPGPWTRFKPRELLGYAKQLGFSEARQKGSHLIVQKGERSVPIPIHKGRDIANGTAISIIKQLGGTYQDYCSHGGA
jgi:predicted RNA binding protein YcfA (HicA-like mRNA interferase family)